MQTFAGDALLQRVSLEQRQSQFADQSQVGRCVSALLAIAVLPKGYIQLPVQAVFDTPMIPQRFSIRAGIRHLAADEVAGLFTGFISDRSLAVTHANRRYPGPVVLLTKAVRVVERRITAILLPAVAAFVGLIGVVLHASKV